MVREPLRRIEVSYELDKLKNLMQTRQEDKDSFLLFIRVIVECVLPFNDVADKDGGYSHDAFLDRRLV